MSYTTTQLATAVLRELGVADASETPDTADLTYVQDKYAAWWEEKASHGNELIYWPSSEIPGPVFLIVQDMMMLECAGAFGQRLDPAEKDARSRALEIRLRKHVQMQSAKLPVQATYF
jgi:hypothetical protein